NINARVEFHLFEIRTDKNLFHPATATDETMHRQCIEKLIGENASAEFRRQTFDPFDSHLAKKRFLMRPHRRTALKHPISNAVILQDVPREATLPCSQLNYREVIEAG